MRHEPSFSLPSLTALVIVSMIGVGVFTTSGVALGDLGTPIWVLWAWAVGGGVTLCGALSYGALARHMTESGGEYLFLSRAIHPLLGFLAGWVSLFAGFTGAFAFAATTLFALGGASLALAVRVIIVMALLTSVSAMVMARPRVHARMADEGVLPALFRMHGKTSRAAIALQVGVAIIVIWQAELQELFSYWGCTLSLSAAATVASLFVLRRREGAQRVVIPGSLFIPGCFVLCTLGFASIAMFHRPQEPLVGLATIVFGLVVYLLLGNNQLVKV